MLYLECKELGRPWKGVKSWELCLDLGLCSVSSEMHSTLKQEIRRSHLCFEKTQWAAMSNSWLSLRLEEETGYENRQQQNSCCVAFGSTGGGSHSVQFGVDPRRLSTWLLCRLPMPISPSALVMELPFQTVIAMRHRRKKRGVDLVPRVDPLSPGHGNVSVCSHLQGVAICCTPGRLTCRTKCPTLRINHAPWSPFVTPCACGLHSPHWGSYSSQAGHAPSLSCCILVHKHWVRMLMA